MKGEFVEWIISIVFTLVGLAVLIVGTMVCASTFEAKNHAVKHTAVISDMKEYRDSDGDRSYDVYVNYTVDGKKYNSRLNIYSSNMYVGKEVTIYYDPDFPDKIIAGAGSEYFMLILPLMGLIFFIVGLAVGFPLFKYSSMKKRVIEYGDLIEAKLESVIVNGSYKLNRKRPHIIICKWTDTYSKTVYLFKSENIWYNPEPIIMARGISSFPVYIDRYDPKKYYMVVDSIK